MDCEKFDQHVIDELYDELDELTHAALRRHVEGCSRCAGVLSSLRATREVGILPLEEPSDDLEARILDAVTIAQRKTPWHKKALRGLAWAGSHAMRPQLAMAALFCLVIGSSLLLLRARPGTIGPVSVTEHGAPAPEAAEPVPAARAVAVAATAAAAGDTLVVGGAQGERAAKAEAPREESAREGKGSADSARTALADARALRDSSGCAAAVGKLDAVAASFPGTQAAADAMWDEATCYKQMGDAQKAQQLYLALRSTGGYRDRAEQELAASESNVKNMQNQAVAAAPAAAAPPPATATATAAATAAPDVVAAAPARAKAAAPKKADADEANAGKADKRAPAGATNPRAPAAPAPRAYDRAFSL